MKTLYVFTGLTLFVSTMLFIYALDFFNYIQKRLNEIKCKPLNNDMLQLMFDKQKVLQQRLYPDATNLPKIVYDKIPITVTSIIAEIGEILETDQNWKPWRKNPPPVDRNNLKTEIADLWHFVINLSLYLGFDATDVYECFMKKNKINHIRQDSNY